MAIAFERVTFCYGDTPVLKEVSITLPERGGICLRGASGCGKTTLLRLLCGLEQPQAGRIHGLSGVTVAAVFQEDRLLPWRSVLDNVRLAADSVSPQRAAALLQKLGLGDELHTRPAALSGGMKRRVAIARALAAEADLLVLDEPFTGLDNDWAAAVAQVIRQEHGDRPFVMVSHDPAEAALMGTKLCEWTQNSPLTGTIF